MKRPVFAAIGHQQDWSSIAAMVDGLRQIERPGGRSLSQAEIAGLIDYLPPRVVSRFALGAAGCDRSIEAVVIETFIRPEELTGRPTHDVLRKVQRAVEAASREGVRVAALGGFTSILVEAGAIVSAGAPALTTGNTLTAALIVRGVERGLRITGGSLVDQDVLVIGGSGDIGSAVSRWLAPRCRSLTLLARNYGRLARERDALGKIGKVILATDLLESLVSATVVIAAASTSDRQFPLDGCRPGVLLCDAGYPKNLDGRRPEGARLFHGGMGRIAGGIRSRDGLLERFYQFPVPNVAHGCMLEGAVLALAGRFEAFSRGRGHITPAAMEEIWALAQEQGVSLAPLFDATGLWPEEAGDG